MCVLVPRPPVPPADLQAKLAEPLGWTLLTRPVDESDRKVALERLASAVLGIAELHVDPRWARTLFDQLAAGPRGAPRRPHDPEKDARLLAFYDATAEGRTPKRLAALPREIGEYMAATPKRFGHGASADAIAVQIRRLLKRRERVRKQQAAELEEWSRHRNAYGMGKSLLS